MTLQTEEAIFYVKGATENVLDICTHFLSNGELRPLSASVKSDIHSQVQDKEDRGMRS